VLEPRWGLFGLDVVDNAVCLPGQYKAPRAASLASRRRSTDTNSSSRLPFPRGSLECARLFVAAAECAPQRAIRPTVTTRTISHTNGLNS
jgi:hypothetical protein